MSQFGSDESIPQWESNSNYALLSNCIVVREYIVHGWIVFQEYVLNGCVAGLSRLTEKDCPVSAAEKCILVYRQELHKASPKLSANREVGFANA